MPKYALGIDFGTLSARALLVDVGTGREVASFVYDYPNAVIDDVLPATGEKLPPEWALQDPRDYLEALERSVTGAMAEAGAAPGDVVGIGVDFTACTILPVDRAGDPLCFDPKWKTQPHAYAKLWKHHAAQPEANEMNELAARLGESFPARYGGKINSEWFFPKALQLLREAPDVYAAADRIIEAGDWMVMQLTGQEARSACQAGYKAMWEKASGYPDRRYFEALAPEFADIVDSKMSRDIRPVGGCAGHLKPEMAAKLGLAPGTAVGVANIDAHVAVPATTVVSEGKMVMIMGTSTCHMVLGREPKVVEGMSGYVQDGILPGFFGFEAGQAGVGDIFAWFVDTCVPADYKKQGDERGLSVHDILTEKAAKQKPGESGLLALDWWNGNRSVLVDADLTGLLVGATLGTRPEDIYRALIEATAFGTRIIIEAFEGSGVVVDEIVACGGLAERNPLLMQIYADVTGRQFKIARSAQTCALGSAMWGAVAAGASGGGYDTIQQAAEKMAGVKDEMYRPDAANRAAYDRLFEMYRELHDLFGRSGTKVMKQLKTLRDEQLGVS